MKTDAAQDHLVEGKYGIRDLIVLDELKILFEQFTSATGFTIGFLDHPGKTLLITTGWRDICTKFHRVCPVSLANCLKSNAHLLDCLNQPGQVVIEECDNGLVDCATPIIVEGKHLASLATGQLLLRPPDPERFRRQAREFGFDEKAYLTALQEIRVVDAEQLKKVTAFLGQLARIVSTQGYMSLRIRKEAEKMAEEVRERRRAEEALRQSEQNYREIFNSTSDSLFIHDEEGRILDVNDRTCAMFVCDRTTALGLSIDAMSLGAAPYSQREAAEFVRRSLKEGLQVFEWRSRRCNGELFWSEVALRACKIADKTRVIASVRDISERRRLLTSEKTAREAAEAASRAKDEFLAIVSHELRTPMTAILGWYWLLREGTLDPADRQQALEVIDRSMRRQKEIIDDILDVSSLVRDQVCLDRRPVDLADTIAAAAAACQVDVQAKRLRLVCAPAPGLTVQGDAQRLRQVFWKLIANAVKFTPEGGTISVSLGRAGDRGVFCVEDTGPGIAPDFLPHIFDLFAQEEEALTRQHGGMGLGLAISKRLVELHGGSITAGPAAAGPGARFTVSLPLAVGPRPAAAPAAVRGAAADCLRGVRVLVVEDDEDTRRMLLAVLAYAGAQTQAAAGGDAAFAVFGRNRPDVLLCDLAMPDGDGHCLIRRIRALPPKEGGEVPAVALTAFTTPAVQAQTLSEGFQRYLPKPVDPAELLQVLGVLARPAAKS